MLGLQTGQGRAAFHPSLCGHTVRAQVLFSELAAGFGIFRKSFRNSSRMACKTECALRGFALMQALIDWPCRMIGRHGYKTILDPKLFTATCKAVVNLTRVHSTLHRLATKPSDRAAARSLSSFTAMLLIAWRRGLRAEPFGSPLNLVL